MTGNPVPTVQTDNEKTRVTKWRFAPGIATRYHVHEDDDVIVPITTGLLALTCSDGIVHAELQAEVSYFREAGVVHDVKTASHREFSFVEVKFK